MSQTSWVRDLAGAVVRHGAKALPFGVGKAFEVIEDVRDRKESADRHAEVLGSVSSVERRIAEVVRAEMLASFDMLRQAHLPPPALEQAVRNLQDIRNFGKHEVFAAEALFANSSYYDLFKKAPQEWGDVLADHDTFSPDGFYVFLDADKIRLVKLKPMMLRLLLADQQRGVPEITLVGTQDLFAERVSVPTPGAPAARPSAPSEKRIIGLGRTTPQWVPPPELTNLHRNATAGDAHAMGALGWALDPANKDFRHPDDAEAARWYRKAADGGHASAMFNLGVGYDNGRGVKQDDAEAIRWYRKAADAGSANGMVNLGRKYEKGQGVKQDDAEAVRWYRKAADGGHASGLFNLGVKYEKGQGVKQDNAEAVRWYRKAADAGHAGGMGGLGWAYVQGVIGLPADRDKGIELLRKAFAGGNAWSGDRLKELGVTP